MGANWDGRWEGGRIRTTSDGTRVWMIERSIGGERYVISLKVSTEREADLELALFLKNPAAYKAGLEGKTPAPTVPVLVDDQAIKDFVAWKRSEGFNELYVRDELEKYLTDWAAVLKTRDLKKASTPELRQMVAKWPTAKHHRITAIKAFAAWCRNEVGTLTSQNDPTLDLKTPKAKKKRAEDEEKAFEIDEVESVYRAIDYQLVRDMVVLTFKFGFHLAELNRFGKGAGKLREVGPWEGCPIVATITVNHKNGDPHTVSLDAQGLGAARRLREAGGCSRSWSYQHLAEVATRNKLPRLLLGSGRHSFITWTQTPGMGVVKHDPPQPAVSLADVMAVTGHRTASTPRHHYDEAQHIPHLLELPLRLRHADDPPLDKVVKLSTKRSSS
ncbi:MAG: hypothetical protein JST54_12445 [Deltaproteobacteria bacterium]|nr:hypothetical protein [Deltaproteobacteria bacterium]